MNKFKTRFYNHLKKNSVTKKETKTEEEKDREKERKKQKNRPEEKEERERKKIAAQFEGMILFCVCSFVQTFIVPFGEKLFSVCYIN